MPSAWLQSLQQQHFTQHLGHLCGASILQPPEPAAVTVLAPPLTLLPGDQQLPLTPQPQALGK